MELIQQELFKHKNNLQILINNLINTQIINREIFINNEIKKECEFIDSLLNQKQNFLIQQNVPNMNLNPNIFQNNMIMGMNNPLINMMPILDLNANNNFNNNDKLDKIINVHFIVDDSHHSHYVVHWSGNEKISEVIKKYREKANDYDIKEKFLYNGKDLDEHTSLTLNQKDIYEGSVIKVIHFGLVC